MELKVQYSCVIVYIVAFKDMGYTKTVVYPELHPLVSAVFYYLLPVLISSIPCGGRAIAPPVNEKIYYT